ncbi:MAG: gas vesicle protein [Proteobacteria bacterium]|nr:gas vesicle protein [Pseudomonadota bacterium]
MSIQRTPPRSAVESSNLADVLERILDKGVIIAGDIRISLVNVELLTIQLRLVICSIDKAKEMGMDWWVNNPIFSRQSAQKANVESSLDKIVERVENLEKSYRDVQSQTPEKST